ncbi:hypothetical protein KAT63_04140 [Candidatus Parcubacteria bacterium]|nr:hypothetical protein [Candidatus Parcubacteria bacterium]
MKPHNSGEQQVVNWIKIGIAVTIFSMAIFVVIIKTGFLISTVSPVSINHILSDTYAKPAANPSLANPNNQTNVHGRKVVKIGSQIWMAENLNTGTRIDGASGQTDNGIIEKYCFNNNEENCATDGGLYQWNEAMGYTVAEGAQGICPNGFHIPTDAELCILEQYVDNSITCGSTGWRGTDGGTKLKTGGASGFESIFAGERYPNGSFKYRGPYAYYTFLWSSTEQTASNGFNAWPRYLSSSVSTIGRYAHGKAHGFSIRCLKNSSLHDPSVSVKKMKP